MYVCSAWLVYGRKEGQAWESRDEANNGMSSEHMVTLWGGKKKKKNVKTAQALFEAVLLLRSRKKEMCSFRQAARACLDRHPPDQGGCLVDRCSLWQKCMVLASNQNHVRTNPATHSSLRPSFACTWI